MLSKLTWRRAALVILYLGLLAGGSVLGHHLYELLRPEMEAADPKALRAMIATATALYVVTSALPFVPGAEIGFGMILIMGSKIAVLVYSAMVAALLVAYAAGRIVPAKALAAFFDYIGLNRARDLVLHTAPLDPKARLEFLASKAPHKIVPFLLRHRYIALLVLLNLPGNSIVGGGGGIALTAGLSGLYPFPGYLATVLIAVAPIPTFVLVTGYGA